MSGVILFRAISVVGVGSNPGGLSSECLVGYAARFSNLRTKNISFDAANDAQYSVHGGVPSTLAVSFNPVDMNLCLQKHAFMILTSHRKASLLAQVPDKNGRVIATARTKELVTMITEGLKMEVGVSKNVVTHVNLQCVAQDSCGSADCCVFLLAEVLINCMLITHKSYLEIV